MEKVRRKYPDILSSQYARTVRAGNMVFISGVTARGSHAEDADVIGQAEVVLDRLQRIMEAEGGSMADIVKITTFVTDFEELRTHDERWRQLLQRCFGVGDVGWEESSPANSSVQVAALAFPYMKIEIEAIAIL